MYILDKGFIQLESVSASDISVVNAARVSFGKHTDILTEADDGLIGYLMREKHGTPFEHNHFKFHVKAPLFVAREWFRHRIGWSYNELSARYSEIPLEAYVPAPENMRTQQGKPGAYTFTQLNNPEEKILRLKLAYYQAFEHYKALLDDGVAKEIARLVLPEGRYTEFYATTNARALLNFFNLRSASTAQWEIQQYSKAMETLFAYHMPLTYNHFVQNGRIAP